MRAFVIAGALLALSASPAQAQVQRVPWAEKQPTASDYRDTYPAQALSEGIEGAVRLLCTVTEARTLDCVVHSEDPAEFGFGDAALALSRLYVVNADEPRAPIGARVIVPIRYVLAD